MRDAGHRTPDIGHRTAKKAKIIYPPPRGVDIIIRKRAVQKLGMGRYEKYVDRDVANAKLYRIRDSAF